MNNVHGEKSLYIIIIVRVFGIVKYGIVSLTLSLSFYLQRVREWAKESDSRGGEPSGIITIIIIRKTACN